VSIDSQESLFMKYAVTGHTQGIGQKLYSRLLPNVIGFSRSTGYDISSKQDRLRIINEAEHCDVFINNAHADFSQVYLLIELLDRWKNLDNKHIINIGSRVSEITLPEKACMFWKYQAEKTALRDTVYKLNTNVKCNLAYKWFGYVGTEKILAKYPHFTEVDYISLDAAADIILS
jgi:hypothetical protein